MRIALFLLIGSLLLIASMIYSKNTNQKTNQKIGLKKQQLEENPYDTLRKTAMNVTPKSLSITLKHADEVYGIIMDQNIGQAIITLVAFNTGDASLYFSTGQIFMGGYAHDNIVKATKEFIELGQTYTSKAVKTERENPTEANKADFYFLTKSGRYYVEESLESLENNESELSQLYYAAHKIITEYRLISKKQN